MRPAQGTKLGVGYSAASVPTGPRPAVPLVFLRASAEARAGSRPWTARPSSMLRRPSRCYPSQP